MTHIIKASKEVACETYGVTLKDLTGERGTAYVSEARKMAMMTCSIAGLSLAQVGRAFGGRHHTTVLHARQSIDRAVALGEIEQDAVDAFIAKAMEKAEAKRVALLPHFYARYTKHNGKEVARWWGSD